MTKPYQRTFIVRLANSVARLAMNLGIAPKDQYILGVRGRKSGRLYSTPVYVMEDQSQRWLVAPYGEVAWVRNARAAGQVTLTQGPATEVVGLVELGATESAPILKKYLARAPITQPYFDVRPDAPLEAFIVEAPRHPVFRLQTITG
jgi:deazaflavin-dependent oxidoreductase (nitroreductase family)